MKVNRCLKAPKFSHACLEPTAQALNPHSNFAIGNAPLGTDLPIRALAKTRYNSPKLRLANTFKQELEHLGVQGMQILPRNPSKDLRGLGETKGLPFQRRARSQSPPRESLRLNAGLHPAKGIKPIQAKFQADDFSGILGPDTGESVEADDDLERMKRDYLALLDQVDGNLSTKNASSSDLKDDEDDSDTIRSDWNRLLGKAVN